MILIKNLRFEVGYNNKDIEKKIVSKLKLKSVNDIKSYFIIKESLDSRRHNDIHYRLNVGVEIDKEEHIVKMVNDNNIMLTNISKYTFPHIINTDVREFLDIAPEFRPVIVGSGPAGYNAAVKLAYAGFKPIVLERGKPVEERVHDINSFWNGENELDPDSNVCFGEGGAGTFSDGKLNTGNKDKGGYFKEVLETFVKYGADSSILYKAKPHIGTDVLRDILKKTRSDIIKYGGEVRFCNKMINLEHEVTIDTFGYESELPIYELTVEDYSEDTKLIYKIKTHSVILATGHSARDTIKMLHNKYFDMEQKAFALGVRVEHSADMINKAMYGEDYMAKYKDKLPTADYKLVYHTKENEASASRSVFSFCMCPGGYVVNSSTEKDSITINGMSYSGRSGKNSNSAIVVNITPEDFGSVDILSGLELQKEIEQKAFKEGNGSIPLQLYKDLKSGVISDKLGTIEPEIKGKWSYGNLRKVLPDFVTDSILEAFPEFGKKIKGFDNDDTLVTAVESRTSSPVRILRDENMMALNFPGIIPAGEGAGYAGGITSAAADGIKSAETVSDYLIEDLIECYKAYETSKYL